MQRTRTAVLGMTALLAVASSLCAQTSEQTWSDKWKADNKRWIAYHLIGLQPDKLDVAKRLVSEGLAPRGFNVLVLEVDYGFQFTSHPELETGGLTKEQARELATVCRDHGIRLIPLMNCLGHQSWGARPGPLLAKYPQFDETPAIPHDDPDIYCREWCPLHPDVNKIVFELIDELIDAFEADAFHVGMDEVFLIGDKNCPRCHDKDVADLFAKVVIDLHDHLVTAKGVEMLMWSDRLLDSKTTGYGRWEASNTGSHRAIERVPKDIIMCDWHYEMPQTYRNMGQEQPFPSVQFFQEQGFRVLPSPWRNPESAVAFLRVAKQGATERMLGALFTGWSVNTEGLLAALESEPKPFKLSAKPDRDETTRGVAATIQAGLEELKSLGP
ncbi:MAG: family 20 glycosylhydrolase [Planctomycetaceae bacterium]|nr:family 20 glycosylhydrolase [Planctomycetaceae bacterium]